jgi:rhodanese-related sulfurtransferase
MNTKNLLILGAALALLAGCSSTTPTQPAPASSTKTDKTEAPLNAKTLPSNVSVAEAAALRESGAFMLDVREQSEWDEFHMPGATLVPLGTLSTQLASLPKDKPIVVVCRSGNRSQTGRDVLLKAGFANVTSMDGGMLGWQRAGLPIEK